MLLLLCLQLWRGEERGIQSRPQLYFTAGFFSSVCLLFIQAMLGYLHDNALFKVLLDGNGSFLFVQWFEPFTVVHWPEAKILLCSVPETSTDSQTIQKPWELPMTVCIWGQSLKLNQWLANSVQSCRQSSLGNQNKLLWRLEADTICIVATSVNFCFSDTETWLLRPTLRDHNWFLIIIFCCGTSVKKEIVWDFPVNGCRGFTDPEPYQRGFWLEFLSYLNYRRSHLSLRYLKDLVGKAFYAVETT